MPIGQDDVTVGRCYQLNVTTNSDCRVKKISSGVVTYETRREHILSSHDLSHDGETHSRTHSVTAAEHTMSLEEFALMVQREILCNRMERVVSRSWTATQDN